MSRRRTVAALSAMTNNARAFAYSQRQELEDEDTRIFSREQFGDLPNDRPITGKFITLPMPVYIETQQAVSTTPSESTFTRVTRALWLVCTLSVIGTALVVALTG